MDGPVASVRIDKWLWAARCFKTRTQATVACDGGLVKINEETAKPARAVKAGDLVEARTPSGLRILLVKALGDRRGTVEAAQALFDDRSPPPPPRVALGEVWDRGGGRPTKRDRRRIDRIRGR
jgi:ribosome-associated heat shock protein Hsp15